MHDAALTDDELEELICRYPEDTDFVAYSVKDTAAAQLRKALWAVPDMLTKALDRKPAYAGENPLFTAGILAGIGYARDYLQIEFCNLGIEPWPAEEANSE